MSMNRTTSADLDDVRYFWMEYGDLSRWSGWEEKKEAFRNEYPELTDAFERYRSAKTTLTAVIKNLPDLEED